MQDSAMPLPSSEEMLSFEGFRSEVLKDYRLARTSREASLLGRKEVLTGKAKFGIFGGGKEVVQVALSKFYKEGDFRSGYYRDQTLMFASGIANTKQFFAQLYADTNPQHEPFAGGRQMSCHYATPNTDSDGNWLPLAEMKNTAADMAPTASQMPRSIGLALASKLFRNNDELKDMTNLSTNGNEVCFCTIGDASTSEGHFWEAINAAGVLQIPLAVFVWDDGYGISVPTDLQTTKASVSKALKGFQKKPDTNGIDIYTVKGWDYAGMCEVFESAINKIRDTHIPAVFHVEELIQPQGHSSSGSHERYKSAERLAWEKNWDCLKKMREWMIENDIANANEIDELDTEIKEEIRQNKQQAWNDYINPLKELARQTADAIEAVKTDDIHLHQEVQSIIKNILAEKEPFIKDIMQGLYKAVNVAGKSGEQLADYYNGLKEKYNNVYGSHLYSNNAKSVTRVTEIKPQFDANAVIVNGYEVLNQYFDKKFEQDKRLVAFGEDVGKIGDVNQAFAGLQQKHGINRIFDTGIRELTIIGKGIGLALRGLRPIAEIQYLDYIYYGLEPLTDDVASLHYRTKGLQSCPLIVRTRGHRLEGIWHSGSPMAIILNALRGMYVCVPRNMTQAAGMYNTLLASNDPAIVVESLNGYRLKEKMPSNLTEFTVPLGVAEVIKKGTDITLVSYGSTLRIVAEVADQLQTRGISCEVIDVQTLLPFDIHQTILKSIQKTNRVAFIDEDVPGGTTAYMFNEVIEKQQAYRWLDATPRTLTAKAHRPAYGTDGDYFSKPNAEEISELVQQMVKE